MDYKGVDGGAMRVAMLNVRSRGAPATLSLAPEVEELAKAPVASLPALDLERKLVQRYEDLEREGAQEAAAAAEAKREEASLASFLDTQGPQPSRTEALPSLASQAKAAEDLPAYPRLQSSTSTDAEAEWNQRSTKVQQMRTATGADDPTCHFFLEATAWNLDEAVKMFFANQ